MTTVQQAALARRQLDRRLGELGPPSRFAVPRSGWLRAIRSALGMSAAVLARRLEVSPQAVRAMELSELDGGIRLRTLQRAARAMDCEFVYAVVPRTTLADIVERQATKIAEETARATAVSMELEDQRVATSRDEIQRRAEQIVAAGRQWRDRS